MTIPSGKSGPEHSRDFLQDGWFALSKPESPNPRFSKFRGIGTIGNHTSCIRREIEGKLQEYWSAAGHGHPKPKSSTLSPETLTGFQGWGFKGLRLTGGG